MLWDALGYDEPFMHEIALARDMELVEALLESSRAAMEARSAPDHELRDALDALGRTQSALMQAIVQSYTAMDFYGIVPPLLTRSAIHNFL